MTPPRFLLAPCSETESVALQRALGVSRVTADALVRRGLAAPDAARRFLDLYGSQHDPTRLGDATRACDLIERAIDDGRRIVVHGDYDADGVCATAVLSGILADLGGSVTPFLPSRFDEGYGLAVETVERLHAEGCGLLVTVDCGITAVDAAHRAAELGLDLVVTDHHRPAASLPACPLVVPRGHGDYPFPELCGTGVAYKLGEALAARRALDPDRLHRYLDLVAVATVADVVPLVDENRGLVRAGLLALRAGQRPGLAALMRVASVDRTSAGASEIAFRLAPRLNAAGRLGHPDVALELLTTDDPARARTLAERLDGLNRQRQAVESEILQDALARLAALPPERREARGIVLADEDWHAGVIGIVAARLVERLRRPVVLIALDGDEGRGSGRSVPAFDLHAGLAACAEHLLGYGGHRAAAGLSIRAGDVDAFAAAFAAHASGALADDDLVPTERIDAVASVADVSLELADELRALEPFGLGNPGVTILVPAVELGGMATLGSEGRHLRFQVRSAAGSCRGVQWSAGGALAALSGGGRFDVACRVERNDWNGGSSVQLVARTLSPLPTALPTLERLCRADCDGSCADGAGASGEPLDEPVVPRGATTGGEPVDRRGGSAIAELTRLAGNGEGLLVLCRDLRRRRALLDVALHPARLGLDGAALVAAGCAPGAVASRLARAQARAVIALADYAALRRHPTLATAFAQVAVLDPPVEAEDRHALGELLAATSVHLVAGGAELEAHARALAARSPRTLCATAWRLLGEGPASASELAARAEAAAAGRDAPAPGAEDLAWALAVLVEAGLVTGAGGRHARREDAPRVRLDTVPAYAARVAEGAGADEAAAGAPRLALAGA